MLLHIGNSDGSLLGGGHHDHGHHHEHNEHNMTDHNHEHDPSINAVEDHVAGSSSTEKSSSMKIISITSSSKKKKKNNKKKSRNGRRFGGRRQNSVVNSIRPFNFRIPKTSFSCKGRAPGYYADMEAECKV